ncbi:hypothetical protein LJB42_000927 [Komagataella kurtzmanii]|nr:hypothetical protein LJB42_000927 [Komagataella kurtzmanii]
MPMSITDNGLGDQHDPDHPGKQSLTPKYAKTRRILSKLRRTSSKTDDNDPRRVSVASHRYSLVPGPIHKKKDEKMEPHHHIHIHNPAVALKNVFQTPSPSVGDSRRRSTTEEPTTLSPTGSVEDLSAFISRKDDSDDEGDDANNNTLTKSFTGFNLNNLSDDDIPTNGNITHMSAWQPPQSWSVKASNMKEQEKSLTLSSTSSTDAESEQSSISSFGKKKDHVESEAIDPNCIHEPNTECPVHGHPHDMTVGDATNEEKKVSEPHHHLYHNQPLVGRLKVFKDNNGRTLNVTINENFRQIIKRLENGHWLNPNEDYRILLRCGGLHEVLSLDDHPLRIQERLLNLSGFTDPDDWKQLDMTYLYKFIFEYNEEKGLNPSIKSRISVRYGRADLKNLDLRTIPNTIHQQAEDIIYLDVSKNPSIFIPLDFIQGCRNTQTLKFTGNRAHSLHKNIFQFANLRNLDLETNYLRQIPKDITLLSTLTNLEISNNRITQLPSNFGELALLRYLNLSSNHIKVIPQEIFDLPNLTELDLSYNSISNIPVEIKNLTKLVTLKLSGNKLAGKVSDSIVELKSIKTLDLRFNQLEDMSCLRTLDNLQNLYLTGNLCTSYTSKVASLRTLQLDLNPVTHFSVIGTLESLRYLDLTKAKLTSLSPSVLSNVPQVTHLILNHNHLSFLPKEISTLKKLKKLSVCNNNLTTLPDEISELQELTSLDLHLNNIKTLPITIWQLNLRELILSSNSLPDTPALTGENKLGNSLLILSLSHNRLRNRYLSNLINFKNLRSLNISYNGIYDLTNGSLGHLKNLTHLYLSGNELTILPDDLESLTNLTVLHLNGNRFQSLPYELSKIPRLSVLDVGSNILKYDISDSPRYWNWNMNKELKYLNFSGNKSLKISSTASTSKDMGEKTTSKFGSLQDLCILGLVDVTWNDTIENSIKTRVRSTPSTFGGYGYGISDTLGRNSSLTTRDCVVEKFREKEDETLICLFDGKNNDVHVTKVLEEVFKNFLETQLDAIDSKMASGTPVDALRRAFLQCNQEINTLIDDPSTGNVDPSHFPGQTKEYLARSGGKTGCSGTVILIQGRKIHVANVGDTLSIKTTSTGEFDVLTQKHEPYEPSEYKRIRASGGFVTTEGKVNDVVDISRAFGFWNLVPTVNAAPRISQFELKATDGAIVLATKELWKLISMDLAFDIIRNDVNNPMIAAETLRDYAISYGCSGNITVIVISLRYKQMVANNQTTRDVLRQEYSNLIKLEDEIYPPVGNVAMVFTDIKNSTKLWETNPISMRTAIKLHNSIMRRQLKIVGGYEVKTEGDAFMVAFPTPTSALLWCFSVQKQLLHESWPEEIIKSPHCARVQDKYGNDLFRGLSVRMGIHWGSPVCEADLITRRMDYFGPMVNLASRVSGVADGGHIALSSQFIHEFEKLDESHEKLKSFTGERFGDQWKQTVAEAYGTDASYACQIESEFEQLEVDKWVFFVIGERKLKGLENPEKICLGYPGSLAERIDCTEQKMDKDEMVATQVVRDRDYGIMGIIAARDIWKLRRIAFRLEHILTVLQSGRVFNDTSSIITDQISMVMTSKLGDEDYFSLLEHVITRIENISNNLALRQETDIALGNDGRLTVLTNEEFMSALSACLHEFKRLKHWGT